MKPRIGHEYWWSPCCNALNTGEDSECWNCGTPAPRGNTKAYKAMWARIELRKCPTCGFTYRSITGGVDELETPCPYYLSEDRHGASARLYYPPNIPPIFWLEVNGLVWSETLNRVIPA